MAHTAVFLDRDGVINHLVYNSEFGTIDSPANPDEFTLLPGVASAVAELNRITSFVIVISNQPGIAKGKTSQKQMDAITEKMLREIRFGGGEIRSVYYCLHHPEAVISELRTDCDCRKPKPGLFFRAARDHDIDLANSFMVGDGVSDVLAGQAAGLRTVFVSGRKCYVCDELVRRQAWPDFVATDLVQAKDAIRSAVELLGSKSIVSRSAERVCAMQTQDQPYVRSYLREAAEILRLLDISSIERLAQRLASLRQRGGRLFLVGVGGGAGHASHAACDFRKIAQIEAYAPSDNVSELTARINDDGWDTSYLNWLKGCRLNEKDMVFVFSVGGGDVTKNVSTNLVRVLQYAKEIGTSICGVVGRDGGYTAEVADECVIVPVVNPMTVTPHTESFQALVWHLLVSHPDLKNSEMKWESVQISK